MAESNQVTLNRATVPGGEVVRTETIGAKQVQLIKLLLGAAGVDDGPVSAANPVPASDATAQARLQEIADALTGTGGANQTLIALLDALADPATSAKQDTSNAGIGAPADAEAAAGDGSVIAILKRLRTLLAQAAYESSGALFVGDAVYDYAPDYTDGAYYYYARTWRLGAALSEAVWQVTRVRIADNQTSYAGTPGSPGVWGAFDQIATPAGLAALDYSQA